MARVSLHTQHGWRQVVCRILRHVCSGGRIDRLSLPATTHPSPLFPFPLSLCVTRTRAHPRHLSPLSAFHPVFQSLSIFSSSLLLPLPLFLSLFHGVHHRRDAIGPTLFAPFLARSFSLAPTFFRDSNASVLFYASVFLRFTRRPRSLSVPRGAERRSAAARSAAQPSAAPPPTREPRRRRRRSHPRLRVLEFLDQSTRADAAAASAGAAHPCRRMESQR